MKKNKRKYNKNRKFEKLLQVFTFLLLVATPVLMAASHASLSKANYQVEKLKKEVLAQERTNQSLEMQINELASLDNIQEVAEEKGLSYNNSNIKSIDSQK